MKRALLLFVIVLAVSVPLAAAREPDVWGAISRLGSAIYGLQTNVGGIHAYLADQPFVKHVSLRDGECTVVAGVGPAGWCPDALQTSFAIPEPDYSATAIIVGQMNVHFETGDGGVDKHLTADMNAVTFHEGVPYLHFSFSLSATPPEGATLGYVLIRRRGA